MACFTFSACRASFSSRVAAETETMPREKISVAARTTDRHLLYIRDSFGERALR
jgi:hypothetical protein